jgi:prepilin-type N-terminal cleavage/methylation domain-containing protein
MTNHTAPQKGFHVVELLIVIVVLAVAGLAGYGVYQRSHKNNDVANNSTSAAAAAPEIKTAKDLDTASSTVDQLDTNTADLDTMEQELNSL